MTPRALVGTAAVLAGCFDPSLREGLPCGPPPELACPEGQTCQADGTCRSSAEADAPGGGDARETIDSPPGTPDAPPDNPDADTGGWTVTRIAELANPGEDQDASMTADGLEIVWASDRAGGLGMDDIWHATRASVTEPFTNLEPLTQLNTTGEEQSPEIGRTGLSLYFVSNQDVWVSFRPTLGADFPAPTMVTGLSTTLVEHNLSVHSNLIAVVDRASATGDRDLYFADRGATGNPWPAGDPITEVNTSTANEGSPFISQDDLTLWFHRADPSAPGTYQIYVATRSDATLPFGPPQPMFQPNDADPWASDDGHTMLITRNDDIYLATHP